MSETLLTTCKELIDDAKTGSNNLVFKEIVLEILARAKNILTNDQFKQLTKYAAEKIQEKTALAEATLPA